MGGASLRGAAGAALAFGAAVLLNVSCTRPADQAQEGGPVPDWDEPLVNGVEVSGVDEARSSLAFEPRLPAELGSPARLLMTDPDSVGPASRVFAAIYDHSSYGRFWVIERVSEMTQAEPRSWTKCDPAIGCEGARTLITVGDSIEAILREGPNATAVVWLVGDLRFDVVGPADTLAAKEAVEVANLVASSTPTESEP